MSKNPAIPPFSMAILAISLFVTLALYAKSFNYQFVYDDDWRIAKNPAVHTLQSPVKYLTDPSTQSALPALNNHTYRPLTTFAHAVGYKLWGDKPGLFRLQNMLFHALNAFLIGCLGMVLFELSPIAALFSAIIFAVHPIQSESVVWVSELSNVLSLTWMLLGLACWIGYRQERKKEYIPLTYLFMVLGFLTRENAVCLAPAIIVIDHVIFKKRDKLHHALFLALTLTYVFARSKLVGHVSQAPFWGGSVLTNLANVLQVLPMYVQSAIWPVNMRMTHFDIPLQTTLSREVVKGILVAIACLLALWMARKKSKRVFCALLLAALFWVPGSGIIPINALFAERLLYPMIAALVWAVGRGLDAQPFKSMQKLALPALLVTSYCASTFRHLPVWRNEDTLWRNVLMYEPKNFFAWACLGNAQVKVTGDLEAAQDFFLHALTLRPPAADAGEILVCLADVNFKMGRHDLGIKYAQEGLKLRPDLRDRLGNW